MTTLVTPFSAETTAAEVLAGVDLAGRRAIVTGGASGIGIETARALAGAGAEVTIAVRDLAAGERTAAEIDGDVRVSRLDLTDPQSVEAFARGWDGPLHMLVANAGVMAAPKTLTAPGWELQFATNHLGHFQLANGLRKALATEGGRIASVSSRGHLRSDVDFDDLFFERREYDPWIAYGQSKTANVLFAVQANAEWGTDGINVNALHPGGILTNLVRHMSDEELRAATANPVEFKTPEQGAATSVLVAASPLLDNVGGRYFEDCNEAPENQPGTRVGVAPYALKPERAKLLWNVSEDLLAAAL